MGRKTVYNAYCDTLGLADYGDSIDEVIKNIKSLIKFHIENFNDREEPKEILVRLIDAFPEYENWINANIGILI